MYLTIAMKILTTFDLIWQILGDLKYCDLYFFFGKNSF